MTRRNPDTDNSAARKVVAILASAGGVTPICRVLSGLPPHLNAAVLVLLHLSPNYRSLMAEILARHCNLNVRQACEGDELIDGSVLVAPPDRHMVVLDKKIALQASPMVHFLRPSGDLLFRSLASSYNQNAIAVVLSGTGTDGASGVTEVKRRGGTVIIQSEATCAFFGMPAAAIATGCADYIVPLEEISDKLISLIDE